MIPQQHFILAHKYCWFYSRMMRDVTKIKRIGKQNK